MFILNKKKHFQAMRADFFNKSVTGVGVLVDMLPTFGAGPYIGKDPEKFVGVSFLYFLYLQSCALHTAYGQKYEKEVSEMLASMSIDMARRCHYIPQKYTDLYVTLRESLTAMAFDEAINKVGLYYGIAVHYLETVFSGEYNPEGAGIYDDRVEFTVANVFQEAMRYYMEYLKK